MKGGLKCTHNTERVFLHRIFFYYNRLKKLRLYLMFLLSSSYLRIVLALPNVQILLQLKPIKWDDTLTNQITERGHFI